MLEAKPKTQNKKPHKQTNKTKTTKLFQEEVQSIKCREKVMKGDLGDKRCSRKERLR